MKNLNKITRIIMKVLEITHWAAAAIMTVIVICSVAVPQHLRNFIDRCPFENESEITAYGFEVTMFDSDGKLNMMTLFLFGIGAVVIYSLMAMIFRNLYLILKKSEGATPFQKCNIRMLTEIGIFSVSVPSVGLFMSTVLRLVLGVDSVETSISCDGFIMGIIVLCLTQFLVRGAELEKDVDGLL